LDLFCFEIGAGGAGVGIDGRVPIICPKAAPPGYEYVVVTVPLQKIWLPCKIRKNLHN